MLKFNHKILRLSAYLVLVSYLSISITNIIHYHTLDIGNKDILFNSINHKDINHLSINGSEIFCPIHFAYSSLNNSTVSIDNPFLEYEKNPEFFGSLLVSSKPTKECINHYQLRAPPISFFS